MPNNGSAGASALEGLVSGFLLGEGVRGRRDQRRTDADEAARRRRIEDEDRTRTRGVQDLETARDFGVVPESFQVRQPGDLEGGLAPDRLSAPPVPGESPVDRLRAGVGANLAPDRFVPEGFQALEGFQTEGQITDAATLERNTIIAQMIGDGVSPQQVSALDESGLLDDFLTERGGFDPAEPLTFEETLDRTRRTTAAESQGRAEGTAAGTPVGPSLDVQAEQASVLAQAREEGRLAAQGDPVADVISPEESALFASLELPPETAAFVQTLSGSERQAFLLDSAKRPTATEQERRAASVLPRAEVGFSEVKSLVDEFGGAPGISAMLGTGAARFAQREQVQRFNAGARAIITAILRVESGAAITAAETNDMVEIMVPQIGDKDSTVELKLRLLTSQMNAIRNAASLVPGSDVNPSLLTPSAQPEETDDEIARIIGGR